MLPKTLIRREHFLTTLRRYNPGTVDDLSQLLRDWNGGDPQTLERLIPIVYAELRRRAHHYMRGERPGHTIQTTALVHEAWLRLVDCDRLAESRAFLRPFRSLNAPYPGRECPAQ